LGEGRWKNASQIREGITIKKLWCFILAIAIGFTLIQRVDSSYAREANYYKGKTVRFVVAYSAGGSYDTYTRAIARHIGKHIPGNPKTVIV